MRTIPLIRSRSLIPFVRYMDALGAPAGRALEDARLPADIAEHPRGFIPTRQNWAFLDRMARDEVPDLGLRVGLEAGLTGIAPDLARALAQTPTLRRGLERFAELVHRESSCMLCWLTPHGENVHFNLVKTFGPATPGYGVTEWLGLAAMLGGIRIFAGARWAPSKIAMRSTDPLPRLAGQRLGPTRILQKYPLAFISIPRRLMALPPACSPQLTASDEGDESEPGTDFVSSLRQALRSYLGSGSPPIGLAAELSGTSTRTLQRRLAEAGLSYRSLVEEARFESARQLFDEGNATSIEIAYALGYTDPSNFARAFRRMAGVSPQEYRRERTGSAPH